MDTQLSIHPAYTEGKADRLTISTQRVPMWGNANSLTISFGGVDVTTFHLSGQDAELLWHLADMDDDQRADLLSLAREINPQADAVAAE